MEKKKTCYVLCRLISMYAISYIGICVMYWHPVREERERNSTIKYYNREKWHFWKTPSFLANLIEQKKSGNYLLSRVIQLCICVSGWSNTFCSCLLSLPNTLEDNETISSEKKLSKRWQSPAERWRRNNISYLHRYARIFHQLLFDFLLMWNFVRS